MNKVLLFSTIILLFNLKKINAQEPTDCINPVVVCGNSNINLNVNGFGIQELSGTSTCGSQENNSLWLKVNIVSGGTLGFILTPQSSDIFEDYDFFVYGPNKSCDDIGQAIRCSTTNPQAAMQNNNLTGMIGSEFDQSEGPGADGNSFVNWLTVLNGETYYIVIDRPHGNSAFSLDWIGSAQFAEPPSNQSSSTTASDLQSCDIVEPFDDGLTTFNLINNANSIIGSQNSVSLGYFLTESDAIIGINELSSPYSNISNPQEIFVRITNDITDCFEVTSFNLHVDIGLDYNQPSDLHYCDDTDDGDNGNGHVVFDLAVKNDEILNGQDPAHINITYYESFNDADIGINPVSNLYYNTIPYSQEIFFRMESIVNPNCYSTSSFNLIVNPIPESFNSSLTQCDEDGIEDGFTLFNLQEAINSLTNGSTNVITKFYLTTIDAENNTNEINGDTFNNTSNPETIYAKIIDGSTNCFSMAELTLDVSTTDSQNTELIVCDDDGIEDGLFQFDLNSANINIVSGLPSGLDISYYPSYQDALLENNRLNTTYANRTPYSETIYARVENANNCYGISELKLTVQKLPEVESESLTYYCLNNYPQTITLDPSMPSASANGYSYVWSTGETSYSIQVNEPGLYTVKVGNADGCFKEKRITVDASNIATIESIKVVDASQNNTITVIVSGEGQYEYTLIDSNGAPYTNYQESNTFENVMPGIYTVNIRDVENNCGITEDLVSVIGFPKYFTPNNDGINDTWQVYGVSDIFQRNSLIYIYDRYGKLVKQLNPTGKGWDGSFNGEPMPNNDYWFAVTLQDGRIFKNHFALKR